MLQNAVLNIYKRFCDFKDFISEPDNNYMLTNLRVYYSKILTFSRNCMLTHNKLITTFKIIELM